MQNYPVGRVKGYVITKFKHTQTPSIFWYIVVGLIFSQIAVAACQV